MDAKQILKELNNTWNDLLGKYYDKILDDLIKHIVKSEKLGEEEAKKKMEELYTKAAPMKQDILSVAKAEISANTTNIKKDEKKKKVNKPVGESSGSSKYSNMSRNELVELCSKHNLPRKRKNQDMIDSLIALGLEESAPVEEPVEKHGESSEEKSPIMNENATDINDNGELTCEEISDEES